MFPQEACKREPRYLLVLAREMSMRFGGASGSGTRGGIRKVGAREAEFGGIKYL